MHQRYHYTAVVQRVVVDSISLSVDTDAGPKAAKRQAEAALGMFPHKIEGVDIPYCYIENRDQIESTVIGLTQVIGVHDDDKSA